MMMMEKGSKIVKLCACIVKFWRVTHRPAGGQIGRGCEIVLIDLNPAYVVEM